MNKEIKERIETIKKGEVPDGYKRTRMGIIPNQWREVQLRDIAKAVTKKNIDNSITVTFTNSATKGVIKQTDYFEKQISNSENTSGYYVVEQDDYIYNPRISDFAPCGPINKSNFEENGIVSPLYTVFKLRNDLKKNKYIEMYLNSSFWHRYMCSVANYGARHDRMNITNSDFFRMPVPFPPLVEQQKIAEILSRCDIIIEKCKKEVEEYKNLKKTCLSKMFPKKGSNVPEIRFPGFTDAWEQRKLGDMASLITKGTTPLDKSNTGDVNFVKVESIDEASGEITITQKITNDEHEGYLRRSQLKENDILFSIAGTLGRVTSVKSSILPANTNQALAIIRLRNGDLQYVKTYLKGRAVSDYIKKNPTIGAQPNLSLEQVGSLEIALPSIEEQCKIGNYFLKLDHLIALHQRKADEYKKMKKALTQLLLTGIVRVNKQKEILP